MPSRPLPLEQLIGAPLRALVLGQGIASQATADFIAEIGFVPTASGKESAARMFEFTYVHPVPDPANPGGVIDTPTHVSVPLLTVLPIPNLRIAEATISFQADIVDMKPAHPRQTEVSVERVKSSVFPVAVQIIAAYAQPTAPEAGGGGALSISIKVARDPVAQGLATVVRLLQEGITSRPEGKR